MGNNGAGLTQVQLDVVVDMIQYVVCFIRLG